MNLLGPLRDDVSSLEVADTRRPVLVPDVSGAPLDYRDNARLGIMLQRYFRVVFRTARRLGVSADACEDAAQEVFLIAAQKLDTIPSEREKQFLYGVTMRVAANRRRAQNGRREVLGSDDARFAVCTEPLADTLLEQKRLRKLLDAVLDELPAELRAVFVLTELEGLSGREIAELLAVPAGTVASRLRRARMLFAEATARLKPEFSSDGGGP